LENSKTETKIPAGGKKIVLVGNPNVGKSVFFNALTGLYVDVSNYPGTTLDMACGRYNGDVVIDTPGVYGVSSFSEEEGITRDIILAADLVINVIDAVHLERDLFLTLQVIDMGIPMVVALVYFSHRSLLSFSYPHFKVIYWFNYLFHSIQQML
jgi:ferrous iron transport protein B